MLGLCWAACSQAGAPRSSAKVAEEREERRLWGSQGRCLMKQRPGILPSSDLEERSQEK